MLEEKKEERGPEKVITVNHRSMSHEIKKNGTKTSAQVYIATKESSSSNTSICCDDSSFTPYMLFLFLAAAFCKCTLYSNYRLLNGKYASALKIFSKDTSKLEIGTQNRIEIGSTLQTDTQVIYMLDTQKWM